jgi:hypothetical protein
MLAHTGLVPRSLANLPCAHEPAVESCSNVLISLHGVSAPSQNGKQNGPSVDLEYEAVLTFSYPELLFLGSGLLLLVLSNEIYGCNIHSE